MIFRAHFEALSLFALRYLHDLDESRNLVHEVFARLWEKYDELSQEDTNFKSYLYSAVRNRCLNHIRDRKAHVEVETADWEGHHIEEQSLETNELKAEIDFAINTLPDKCRMVFLYSREHELSYAQIADKMAISVKTVENQMSKALKHLRAHLADYLLLLFLLHYIGVMAT